MPVEFGLALVESHPKTKILSQWMDNLDVIAPQIEGHFKSLWMTDHLFWNDDYAYEVWTTLSYIAARYPSFDVGPMVMGQNYRNPGLLAKMASTLQVFSQGRFIMGLGAGWKEDEYKAFDWELPSAKVRLEQLEDTIDICRALWTQPGKVSYTGKHYKIVDAYLEPKPDPVPPICVGVSGDKALGIAARKADWWNLSDCNIARFKERMSVLDSHAEKAGRDSKEIRRTWFGRVVTGATEAEIQNRANSWKQPFTTENAFVGKPAQIVEQMHEFVEAGCDYFMIDILGLPNTDILSMVVNEIVPRVQRFGS